ncbi:hypothetical protein C7C46_09475 [Streptomyces tateyamensis]|uniref:Uncharacterized protein n=1 Tax=Streptomyces tateyamensis TaxID=565073 RepID=A0A2V4NJU2_9ACTN|nr:hypothetical protein [Streptomyces tateyamensis]PYC82584.1 hypothetical protein C7C46_09475 [Streptomyces tateyamensis]
MINAKKPGLLADLSHVAMDAALGDGTAEYLSETIRDFVRLRGSWWMFDRAGWWEVTRADVADGLDLMAENMRLADLAVRRNTG